MVVQREEHQQMEKDEGGWGWGWGWGRKIHPLWTWLMLGVCLQSMFRGGGGGGGLAPTVWYSLAPPGRWVRSPGRSRNSALSKTSWKTGECTSKYFKVQLLQVQLHQHCSFSLSLCVSIKRSGTSALAHSCGLVCPKQKQRPQLTTLTWTFLFRLTAGTKTPSRLVKAVGPCCSLLMKKVRVCLTRSSRTPTVEPLVMPPSALQVEDHSDIKPVVAVRTEPKTHLPQFIAYLWSDTYRQSDVTTNKVLSFLLTASIKTNKNKNILFYCHKTWI